MTNPYIPNSAHIPNILFDYWMSRLTPGEWKIVSAIARKTYGWNKSRDRISLRQMQEITGLSRKSIYQMIESLVERGLIIKIKSKTELGDDAPNMYEINIDCKEGIGNSEGGGGELQPPQVGTPGTPPVGTAGTPQNTPNTKDTIQKREEGMPPPLSPQFCKKKEKVKLEKKVYRENVLLTENEHAKLLTQYGQEKLNWMLDYLEAKKGANGNVYESDYHVLLPANWVHAEYQKQLKEGKLDSAKVVNSDHVFKNKKIAEFIEEKLRSKFTGYVYLQAMTDHVLLYHKDKDISKNINYSAYETAQFKEIILREAERFFPGVKEIFKVDKDQKVNDLVSKISQKFKIQDKI